MKMIELYLFSIVVWLLMIFGTIYLFKDKIKENGWLEYPKTTKKFSWIVMFLACAIPFIRVIYFLAVIMMAGMATEQFEEFKEESK